MGYFGGVAVVSRSVPEWIGKTDDTPVPPRVKLRLVTAQDNLCAACTQPFGPQRKPEFDHFIALCNGGKNAEDNIVAICAPCHKAKTPADVAEKSKVAKVRKKHLGIAKAKRSMIGSSDSKWKRFMDGHWERRPESTNDR